MKKLILAIMAGAISLTANADQPLRLSNGTSQVIGTNPLYVHEDSPGNKDSQWAVTFGYAGGMIDEGDVKLRFKGFDLGLNYFVNDKAGVFVEYEYQKDEIKLQEFSVGGTYKFYDSNKVYVTGSAGLGYAWVDGSEDGDSIDLEYLTIPVGVEVGYKVTPSFALYGGLGYRWLFNQDSEACLDGECVDAGNLSELDTNGTTYRAGIRYSF